MSLVFFFSSPWLKFVTELYLDDDFLAVNAHSIADKM